MSSPTRPFDPDLLVAHAGCVRKLARSLVPRDLHLADDVAQEACLAALEKRPATDRPIGAWLTSVVRNLVLQDRRGSARRSAREQSAARPEAQPSTLDHLATLSVHAKLVEAVLGLSEPYRETMVLRFFDELSPSAIARRQSVPVATVKTRLARGLAELRAKLDRAHGGDGRGWLLALIPICKPSGGLAATTLGALLVTTNIKIALAGAVIACGFFAWWLSDMDEAPAIAAGSSLEAPAVAGEPRHSEKKAPLFVEEPRAERQTAATPVETPAPDVPPVVAPVGRLQGRVLDVTVQPLSGVHVQFTAGRHQLSSRELHVPSVRPEADAPAATTDATGSFELPVPETLGQLSVSDDRWTTVLSSLCGPDSTGLDHVVVVAPRLAHSGRVTDAGGLPLAGARIEIRLPPALRVAFPHILDSSTECSWVAESDAQGRFALDEAPQVDGAKLGASLDGYVPVMQDAPGSSDRALEIVLRRPEVEEGMVAGQVLDANGRSVAGARVSLGRQACAVSDESGSFLLAIPKEGPRTPWIALKAGLQPAVEDASSAVRSGRAEAGEFIVLRLGPAPLAISGRVVDSQDRPQDGFKVFLADPTYFGAPDELPAHVEGLLSGAADRAALEAIIASAPVGSSPEEIMKDASTVFWTFVETGSDGRFRIDGLLDRTYRIAAIDTATLLRVETGPIPAGSEDVSIRTPEDSLLKNVRGKIVTRAGEPVAGVTLTPKHDVISVQLDAYSRSTFGTGAPAATTDAEGRFAFERLPREKVHLEVTGQHILPIDWARAGGIEAAAGGKAGEIVIVVALRYHMQVEMEPHVADEVRVLDADGEPLAIHVFEGNTRMSLARVLLHEGRSKVMAVGEEARTLVLWKEEREVRRLILALRPGELNVVRP